MDLCVHVFYFDLFFSLRKLYWTDGDNISMANMDGSNQTTLFTNQKGPVGEHMFLFIRRNCYIIVDLGLIICWSRQYQGFHVCWKNWEMNDEFSSHGK